MICERCGKEISDSAAICPSCGTVIRLTGAQVPLANNYTSPPDKNNAALIVEVLLSLFGIYGVGWSMAGKKTVGTMLIICSIVYWFLALRFIFLTWGFGLLCLGPLSIVLIIVNAILLNNALKQRMMQFQTVQAQQMQRPPRQWPPQ